MSEEKITYQCCQGWGCHERCIIETHVVDGKIVRTQKSNLPGKVGPGNQICQKGVQNWQIPYTDKRILHPLKRVGERGEGKFEQITWDEALDTIGNAINESAEKYGRRSIITNLFYCGYPGNRSSVGNSLGDRFINTYGASKLEYEAVDKSLAHHEVADTGFPYASGRENYAKPHNCLLIWGGNPIGFTRAAATTHMIFDARDNGATIINVSNFFDNTAAMTDIWVPVKSDTDVALALAMANVLIRDGLVNEEFLLDETTAAYLVRQDTGKYLRMADVDPEGSADEFVVIDTRTGKPAAVPVQQQRHTGYGDVAPQLEVECELNGIACKSAYVLLKEHVAPYTPEYQETITGAPAELCEKVAHVYAESSPSLIAVGSGMRYQDGTETLRAVKLLAYLTGNYGREDGGTVITGGVEVAGPNQIDRMHIQFEKTLPMDLGIVVSMEEVLESFQDPTKQQYKVWINYMGNVLLNWPNKDLWRNRILPNLDLFVEIEIRMTDTCRYADIVLPEATVFERCEVNTDSDNSIVLCEPAIEPLGESRTPADIWRGIAERVGVGQYFQKTQEEWVQETLEGTSTPVILPIEEREDPNRVGEMEPVTFERLSKVKTMRMCPDGPFDPYHLFPFATLTGRIQFYTEELVEAGVPMASEELSIIKDPELKKDYPLHFFIGRHKYFMQGQFTEVPEMVALAKEQFGVAVNPVEAIARGLKDGDEVVVFNQRASMKSKLQVRDDIPVGMAHTWYSFDETYYPDNNTPQDLATPNATAETVTPASEAVSQMFYDVQVKFGLPPAALFIEGRRAPEVIFDQLCEIRKAD